MNEYSKNELILLNNALNEILHGREAIDDHEFHARSGSTREEAKKLLKKLGSQLSTVKPSDIFRLPPDRSVRIDGMLITDFDTFHAEFKKQMDFPDFYGDNMNAWIDCMGDIHEDTKMSKFFLPADQSLIILVENADIFSKVCPDVFDAFINDVAFVNRELIKSSAPLQVIFS